MELKSNNKRLNMKDRIFYRKEIETLLTTEFKNEKVRISNELLDQLLFEEVILNEKENIVIKFPVWSGEFLQQIDLSAVDFSNVSWTGLSYLEKNNNIIDENDINNYYKKLKDNVNVSDEVLYADLEFYRERIKSENKNFFLDYITSIAPNNLLDDKELLLERIKEISSVYRYTNMRVNYGNTNANIDLSKSIEAKLDNSICVCNCDFNGCNVYISEEPDHLYLQKTDFSNSKINLPNKVYDTNINDCYFENCDLSNTTFDVTSMLSEGCSLNCLRNSKAKLCYEKYNFEYFIVFKNAYLSGCYINDELVDNICFLPEIEQPKNL